MWGLLFFPQIITVVNMAITIDTRIQEISRINRKIMPPLNRLGIKTIRDLLLYFPSRYEDFSNQKFIRDAVLNETVTIRGVIQKISTVRTARKKMFLTQAILRDETGDIKAIWFNQPFLERTLRIGTSINLSGKIAIGPQGIYLQNPAYEKIEKLDDTRHTGNEKQSIHTGGLIAIYPETQGITSRWLRFLIKTFIELRNTIPDCIPEELRNRMQIPELHEAILAIHFPKTLEDTERAQKRFAFESMLLIQLRALKERSRLKQHLAPVIPIDIALIKKLIASLPFSLTNAQRRSLWEILKDMEKPRPMNRLLEGDVGSGKTVVAAAAALSTAQAGFKTAFMAPTEILARQHYETLRKVLTPFNIKIGLLTGSEKKVLPDSEIIIGTHALIQKNITFQNLGLVVIDEQHRFGVQQRRRLTQIETQLLPHFLSMTATPIPRTLALTIYGDLDLSILDEMPQSRKQIITQIVEPKKREEAYKFIREEIKKGRQIFVVCPRIEIENSNAKFQFPPHQNKFDAGQASSSFQQKIFKAEMKSVKNEYEKLSKHIFPDFRVGMLHGKMKPKEKEIVMQKFKNKELDILVSTSVIEVGIDIPNATLMMIEGAERFGLATLHQFRGRVGRGADQSYCFLFPSEDGITTRRLHAVVEAKTGFELAEKDLKIRGAGDIFGRRQWGISDITLNALTDAKLVREVRKEGIELLKRSPNLSLYPLLRERLNEFEKSVHLE